MKLHKQPMNVKDYIQDVVSSIAAEAREKGITIHFKRGFSNNNETSGNDDVSIANVSIQRGSLHTSRKVVASNRLYGAVQILGVGVDRSMKSVRRSVGSIRSNGKGSNLTHNPQPICTRKCLSLLHHLITSPSPHRVISLCDESSLAMPTWKSTHLIINSG